MNEIESQIIDAIDQYLMSSSPSYRAASKEYERLGDLLDTYAEIVDYIKALNEAYKQTRGAMGAHIADFIIPGPIGTIGAAIQTNKSSQSQNKAREVFERIPTREGKELIKLRDTKISDLLEGLDVIFDAVQTATRQGGLDLTSAVNAINHSLTAGDIKKAMTASLGLLNKLEAVPDVTQKFKNYEGIIESSIANTRKRVTKNVA